MHTRNGYQIELRACKIMSSTRARLALKAADAGWRIATRPPTLSWPFVAAADPIHLSCAQSVVAQAFS